jgi:hypothetical protein
MIKKTKLIIKSGMPLFLSFGYLNFEFVSDFDIRI